MLRYAIRTEHVDRLIRLLASVLGVPIAFFDMEHRKLGAFDVSPDSAYCSALRRNRAFNSLCEQCDRDHLALARRSARPITYTCHNNLRETVVPLFDERANYLGAIVFGQIRVDGLKPRQPGGAALKKLYAQLPAYSEREIRNIVDLLSYFAQYIVQNHLVAARSAPWTERIRAHVDSHLDAPLTVRALADAAGVSSSQVSHAFRTQLGMSPAQYVRQQRVARARDMLLRGTPVKQVAYSLGFCDEFHFSKVFKRMYGASPRRWAAAQSV